MKQVSISFSMVLPIVLLEFLLKHFLVAQLLVWCTFHLQEKYLLSTHNKTPYSFLLKNLSSYNVVGHQVIKPSQHPDNINMQRSGFKPSAKLGLGKSIEKCKLCNNCKSRITKIFQQSYMKRQHHSTGWPYISCIP